MKKYERIREFSNPGGNNSISDGLRQRIQYREL